MLSRQTVSRTSASRDQTSVLSTGPGPWARDLRRDIGHAQSRTLSELGQLGIGAAPFGSLQAKFVLGQPNDPYEQEADRVADQVLAMARPRDPIGTNARPPEPGMLQPFCSNGQEEEDREKLVQRTSPAMATCDSAPPIDGAIRSLQGDGQPLSSADRDFFEPRFGVDFTKVRIHADAHDGDVAKSINARALTLGRDVVFARGEYSPATLAGKRLLAHELTHVVQQSGGTRDFRGTGIVQRQPVQGEGTKEAGLQGSASPLCIFCPSMCPADKVKWIKRTVGKQPREYFEISVGIKDCTVFVVWEDADDTGEPVWFLRSADASQQGRDQGVCDIRLAAGRPQLRRPAKGRGRQGELNPVQVARNPLWTPEQSTELSAALAVVPSK